MSDHGGRAVSECAQTRPMPRRAGEALAGIDVCGSSSCTARVPREIVSYAASGGVDAAGTLPPRMYAMGATHAVKTGRHRRRGHGARAQAAEGEAAAGRVIAFVAGSRKERGSE